MVEANSYGSPRETLLIHDVAGSSPAGGAKTKTTQSGGLLFWLFSSLLNPATSKITAISERSEEMTAQFGGFALRN